MSSTAWAQPRQLSFNRYERQRRVQSAFPTADTILQIHDDIKTACYRYEHTKLQSFYLLLSKGTYILIRKCQGPVKKVWRLNPRRMTKILKAFIVATPVCQKRNFIWKNSFVPHFIEICCLWCDSVLLTPSLVQWMAWYRQVMRTTPITIEFNITMTS